MKRYSFLLALFGGAAAAETISITRPRFRCTSSTGLGIDDEECERIARFGKIQANNRCPVCGTMAESYKRASLVRTTDCDPIPGSQFGVACKVASDPIGEPSQIARCKRCNAAFWQDAEEAKK